MFGELGFMALVKKDSERRCGSDCKPSVPLLQTHMISGPAVSRAKLVSHLGQMMADRTKIIEQYSDCFLRLGLFGNAFWHYAEMFDRNFHGSWHIFVLGNR